MIMPGEQIEGDVNADGLCGWSDAELLQSWLLAKPDTALQNWNAGDLNNDSRLTAADLSLLRQIILNHNTLQSDPS